MPTRLSRLARKTARAAEVLGGEEAGSHPCASATAMPTLEITMTAVATAVPRTPKSRAAASATTV